MTVLGSYHSWMGGRIYLNLLENMLNQSMAGSVSMRWPMHI